MNFTTAAACEQVVWQMRLADYPRALNRASMNALYNGAPPYTEQEQIQNRITTNVNSLEGTKILHDARRQFATAFMSSDPLFTVTLDHGPEWRRREWGTRITTEINRIIGRSLPYLEQRRSVFAGTVLHGIGPSNWEDREKWCSRALGIEDVLVPSNTLTSLENLPFFAVFRQYTGAELYKLTHGPNVDKAWNMPLVDQAIAWVDQRAQTLMSSSWPEVWSPEKMEERIKQDGGLYASDAVPTIDTFDLYFWNDSGKKSGWNRRIILDAWGEPGVGGAGGIVPDKNYLGTRNQFLYDPGDRKYADKIGEIIHFQFADASCVAPFRYHSVRSLGFLLYAVCHLQNRLRCKFNDSVFENLLQYFRVNNPQDAERLSKVDLIDKGIIPEGLDFVKQGDRWQINEAMANNAISMNRQMLADNSASFTQDFDGNAEDARETATRTMAKVNATAALVGSMLNQAYNYQAFQYYEICRRFCIPNSKDPDVRKFRLLCLKAGVPVEALDVDKWDVQPVRVIGSGNKTLQVAMADKLMGIRPQLDPDGQREVDRIYILANSDDPDLADRLVPQSQHVSDSMHDAQVSVSTILLGLPVTVEDGMNHVEYVESWLHAMATVIQKIEGRGGMATPDELAGLNNLAQHIGQQIQLVAQDKAMNSQVKVYGDDLSKMMNLVKAYTQRLQAQQQQQAQTSGPDPEAQAKIDAIKLVADTKAQIATESHAQKTAQRQIAFQQTLKQDAIKHHVGLAATDLETAANIRRGNQEQTANEETQGKVD